MLPTELVIWDTEVRQHVLWYRRWLITSLHIQHRLNEKGTILSALQPYLYSFSPLVNVQTSSHHTIFQHILFFVGQSHRVFLCTNTEIPQPKSSLPMEPHLSTDYEMRDNLFSFLPSEEAYGPYLLPSCFWAWRAKKENKESLIPGFVLGFVVTLSKLLGEAETCNLWASLTFLRWG